VVGVAGRSRDGSKAGIVAEGMSTQQMAKGVAVEVGVVEGQGMPA